MFSPRLSRFLPRLTVPLPALPVVHLSAQREVHVKPPVRLQLGERGHFRLRHTPHKKINCMKELGSEVARQAERSQPTQPNLNPIHRTGRPVTTEQTSRSSAQEIDTPFLLGCENINLSVERLDKDKDTDENVDADRVRKGRRWM